MKNKFGLSRSISSQVKIQVRLNSKNGCVNCRKGIYQYEHILPEFKDAKIHDPERICCLCASCHDKVTRGLLSKETISRKYLEIKNSTEPIFPSEFFDFYGENTFLKFGDLISRVTPNSLLTCYGQSLFSIIPGKENEIGKINALFFDGDNKKLFEINGNEWIGPNDYFDLEIIGQKFTLRLPNGKIGLKLIHNPPNGIEIDRLDMRYKDIHFLISSRDFAIGRYNGYEKNLIWIHFKGRIDSIFNQSVGINITKINPSNKEFEKGISIKDLGLLMNMQGTKEGVLTTNIEKTNHVNIDDGGFIWPALGFEIAKGCQISFTGMLTGICSLKHARQHFFSKNRMNTATYYLPPVIDKESLEKEKRRSEEMQKSIHKNTKKAFLAIPDKFAIQKWEKRQNKNFSKIIKSPFLDDKPGLYSAYGVIKQVDEYDGPSIRIYKN